MLPRVNLRFKSASSAEGCSSSWTHWQPSGSAATEQRRPSQERERFSVELKLIEQKLATETKRANKASADYLRMLGERDQLEWLVKRQPDGDHRGSGRSVCEVCRKSVGLATTPRDSATRQCL